MLITVHMTATNNVLSMFINCTMRHPQVLSQLINVACLPLVGVEI